MKCEWIFWLKGLVCSKSRSNEQLHHFPATKTKTPWRRQWGRKWKEKKTGGVDKPHVPFEEERRNSIRGSRAF